MYILQIVISGKNIQPIKTCLCSLAFYENCDLQNDSTNWKMKSKHISCFSENNSIVPLSCLYKFSQIYVYNIMQSFVYN